MRFTFDKTVWRFAGANDLSRCRPSHSVLLLTVASTRSEETTAGPLFKNRPVEFIFAIKVYLSLDGNASVSEGTYVPCIPRALLALLSPVIRGKVRSTIRFSPRKSEQNPRSQPRGMALVSDKVKYRSDTGPSFPRAFPLLTLASNYNVTSRRRRLGCRRGRCGPAIYRGRHIAEIFSRRIWLSGQDGGG